MDQFDRSFGVLDAGITWKICIRRGGKALHHITHDLHAAIAVACLLLRDGITVERIEGPDGEIIDPEGVLPICDDAAPYRQRRDGPDRRPSAANVATDDRDPAFRRWTRALLPMPFARNSRN